MAEISTVLLYPLVLSCYPSGSPIGLLLCLFFLHGLRSFLLLLEQGNVGVQDSGEYKGIKTATGQLLYSGNLIAGPSFHFDPMPIPSRGTPTTSNQGQTEQDIARCVSSEGATTSSAVTDGILDSTKVARCICITNRSLQPGLSTILVHFPPRCEHSSPICFFSYIS